MRDKYMRDNEHDSSDPESEVCSYPPCRHNKTLPEVSSAYSKTGVNRTMILTIRDVAFYMCGLEEAAAAEAARMVGMPSRVNEDSMFDHPSWSLYRYWLSQSPSCRVAQTSKSQSHRRPARQSFGGSK